MTRTTMILPIASLFCLMFAARVESHEPGDHAEARQRESRLQLREAEFDVKMHEIELAMSERAVEEAKVEMEKVQEHADAAQKRRELDQPRLTGLERKQAQIHLAMQELRSEMARLALERARARLQLRKSVVTEKPEKRHRVQLEYVDDLDVVIIRGSKEGVDKIRALIESAEKHKDD